MHHIYFTVTNDLTYDQRMHRICSSLSENGYNVTLVGRKLNNSIPISNRSYDQKRIKCIFNSGFLFYAEYNLRLFFFLLFKKMDAICAIDLDTILPCLLISKIKSIPRIYDAHEYFTEMKEVRTRPLIHKFWSFIERVTVPHFKHAYTVSDGLAEAFKKKYDIHFRTVRNLPVLHPIQNIKVANPYLFFGGAVNEARGLEYLIPAMRQINCKLIIVGDGNYMATLKDDVKNFGVTDKIDIKGMLPPSELRIYAEKATLGIGLAEKEGINQYWALSNKFSEYIHAGLPQITMNYPEYEKINKRFKVAVLIDNLDEVQIASQINKLLLNETLLKQMRDNCLKAREIYNWQTEEKELLSLYKTIIN